LQFAIEADAFQSQIVNRKLQIENEGTMSEKTILVADDESHILHVVSLKLRNAGFRVITARDGQEALEMAQAQHPDLLITDYHMPQLSGLELCQRLKQDARTSDIPAIMLTARGYHLEPRDTEQSGILRMLSKPFSPRHLLLTVNEVLEGKAA
jgi:CheY-like chemotaxis protein